MASNDTTNIKDISSHQSCSSTSSFSQNPISLSSSNSPINIGNLSSSLSRGRQLWNTAVENVLEHEETPPSSSSIVSSTIGNDAIGWYNLTKR
ncbi:unnamed protein product [Rotaria sp. Silwood2]|nr:unnamed protein product [Rotaria sp. Silwood2]CAF2544926.1 unnamed protein product [Rotaria sp. Silwood2]CAF2796215.1 unnamed protein product [Rotaria sp. Silwood2]CAF2925356.1 unnamed protein product [Rotaria sp. Silwood2]CAF3955497.1 unnamed protein product [Rotaria sp. Silwood2]